MAINGSLQTMSVPDLLQFLAVGKKTGLLKLNRGKVIKGIYFEQGIIVGSSTNDPTEYLGQVLMHYGKIDEAQLLAAMKVQRGEVSSPQNGVSSSEFGVSSRQGSSPTPGSPTAQRRWGGTVREDAQSSVQSPMSNVQSPQPRVVQPRKRLGQILVDQGIITDSEVREVLEIRTLDIIYDLFIWKEGHFEFLIEDPLPPDFTRVNLEPTKVIMEGVYRGDELTRYRTLIPSDRTVMELGAGWTSSLGIGKETRQLLYFLEKRMSVAEICYNMHSPSFEVYGQLYDLVQRGLARVAGELPEIPQPVSEAPDLPEAASDSLLLAREELNSNEVESALSIIQTVLRREPKNEAAHSLLVETEKRFIEQVYSEMSPSGVPKIVIELEELGKKDIEPQEGFVLSRINGEWDIQSILSICPFREADSLRMIKKLWDNGIIGF